MNKTENEIYKNIYIFSKPGSSSEKCPFLNSFLEGPTSSKESPLDVLILFCKSSIFLELLAARPASFTTVTTVSVWCGEKIVVKIRKEKGIKKIQENL